jgi:peptide/nickel transport system permease protein
MADIADRKLPNATLVPGLRQLTTTLGLVGTAFALILLMLLLVGFLEPYMPFSQAKTIGFGPRRAPPNLEFWLGTDNLGRSILARILEGVRLTFLVSVIAVAAAGIAGAIIGMAAAWYRGIFEILITRLADVIFAFPAIIFGLIISTIIGPGTMSAVIAIFFIVLPTMVRVVRSASMSVVSRDFVIAARISGATTFRILFIHILPNVASATIVQMAYLLSIGMLIESGLSFLGLGVQPPSSSLGALLRENSAYLSIAPWMVLAPGAVLTLTIFGVNFVGDAMHSVIDPVAPKPLASGRSH